MNISKDFKGIEKFSIVYSTLKIYIDYFLRFMFRRFTVIGLENVPKNKAFIIAPNHQVALDPIVILKLFKQPVFISRADIFKKRTLAKFLIFSKIMPTFRMRDGKENLKFNHDVFQVLAEVLKSGNPVVIFPEGTHFDKRHLLPLRKGMTRLAFTAEEKSDFKLDLHIVPVGIYYSNIQNFKSDIRIIFGKPISVGKYKELYFENEPKANAKLRDEVALGLRENLIDIRDLENYEAYDIARISCQNEMLTSLNLTKNEQNILISDKETIKRIEQLQAKNQEKALSFFAKAKEYSNKLKKYNFRNWQFEKEDFTPMSLFFESVLFISVFPFFLYGFLNNILAIQPQRILNNKSKETQFDSFMALYLKIVGNQNSYLERF